MTSLKATAALLARRAVAVSVAAGAAVPLLPGTAAHAVPVRGTSAWSVILCKFSDVAAQPQPPSFFDRFVGRSGAGQGGLYDYFLDQSYGKVQISADVRGWYTMPYSLATESGKSRWEKINDCVATARANGYTAPTGSRVMAVTNAQQDGGESGGMVLLDQPAVSVAFAAHEMGHSFGLDHSYSNDLSYRNAPWAQPGEYDDPWDEMSALNVYGSTTAGFGAGAVGFNAFHRDKLGWLPKDRIDTFGADGTGSATRYLTALETPSAGSDPLLIRVPFDPADPFHYYTVEFRRKTAWSQGIPADTVLIHEVRNGRPTLQRNLSATGKPPAQSLSANGVTITVGPLTSSRATVTITSDLARRCLDGFVWREARPSDQVCVTPATRSQVGYDNSVAGSRWVNGSSGPNTCIDGYVWREAFAGDVVCVTPAVRSQAATDNSQAAERRNPARLVGGPNSCLDGYVWREADPSDYACVTPAARAQAAADNSVRAWRWVNGSYGPNTCVSGYVWRDAWPGDTVCVTPEVRTQTAEDNAQAPARVQRAGG